MDDFETEYDRLSRNLADKLRRDDVSMATRDDEMLAHRLTEDQAQYSVNSEKDNPIMHPIICVINMIKHVKCVISFHDFWELYIDHTCTCSLYCNFF